MPARFIAGHWRYRKLVTLLDGTKERISGTPDINTKAAAEAAERAHIDRLLYPAKAAERAAAVRAIERVAKGGEPTIGELIDQMIERYQEGSKAANRSRAQLLNTDVRPYFGSMRASEITQAQLNAFRDELRRKPGRRAGTKLADQSIRNRMFALTRLISWAVEEELIEEPERAIVVKVKASQAVRSADDPEVQPVSLDDVTKLLRAAWDPRYRVAILLAAECGLRIGEIIGARWTDIRDGSITIQRSISARNDIGPPKGKITRVVPLSPATRKELERVPKRGFYILTRNEDDPGARRNVKRASEPGGHVGYSGLNKAIKAVYRKASVPFGWSEAGTINVWHSLRHTYGTRLVAEGVQGDLIQRLMGHKDYRTTQRYITVTRDQLKAAIARVFG